MKDFAGRLDVGVHQDSAIHQVVEHRAASSPNATAILWTFSFGENAPALPAVFSVIDSAARRI